MMLEMVSSQQRRCSVSSERLPLRGCLNPDGNHYVLMYISQSGRLEECFDETKTLRQLKPFKNILKFGKRQRDQDHYHVRKHIGNKEHDGVGDGCESESKQESKTQE